MLFRLSALWWRRGGLWKLPDRRDWLSRKLDLVLMGRAMLSEFNLIFCWWVELFSLPAPYLGPNYGGGKKTMVTSGKTSQACTAALSAPALQQATTNPRLCWRLLDTPRQVWVSLFWDHCSFPLDPSWCTQDSVCALQESNTQACVSSGSSVVGLMATSSNRAMPCPSLLHPGPPSLWQSTADLYLHRRGSNTVLSWSLWGPWVLVCTRFV